MVSTTLERSSRSRSSAGGGNSRLIPPARPATLARAWDRSLAAALGPPAATPGHGSPEIVSLMVLPPLLYPAGQDLPWRDLRAVCVAGCASSHWPGRRVRAALAVVAAAVTPLSGPHGVRARGRAGQRRTRSRSPRSAATSRYRRACKPSIHAESLFNDATSLVLFRVAVSFAAVPRRFGLLGRGALASSSLLAGGGARPARSPPGRRADAAPHRRPGTGNRLALVTPYAAIVVAETRTSRG